MTTLQELVFCLFIIGYTFITLKRLTKNIEDVLDANWFQKINLSFLAIVLVVAWIYLPYIVYKTIIQYVSI